MGFISILTMVYKPTNITGGAPPCMGYHSGFEGEAPWRRSHAYHAWMIPHSPSTVWGMNCLLSICKIENHHIPGSNNHLIICLGCITRCKPFGDLTSLNMAP